MQFIESIRFEHGQFHLLDLHQARIDRTFASFFPRAVPHQLDQILPTIDREDKVKCRVVYDVRDYHAEWMPYQPRLIRKVQMVEVGSFDYAFKYADRSTIQDWVNRSAADDIIMIKNGFVTDSSYANLAFFDGKDWLTPRRPLLNGVRRQHLIGQDLLFEADIRAGDLARFDRACLINAMLGLGEVTIPIF